MIQNELPSWRVILGDCIAGMATLPPASVNCCVTSPPYWGLRDYGVDGQIGLESTPAEYLARMVEVFRSVRRVLRDDGTCWVNMGDGYARQGGDGPGGGNRELMHMEGTQIRNCVPPPGLKSKDLIGMPWRLAFALQADGWYLRSDIIWHKPNPMPESVTDRPTKSHEYLFLLSKNERYYYDAEAIKEPAIHAGDVKTNNNGKNGRMGDAGQTRTGFMKEGGITVPDTRNIRTVWTIPTQAYPGSHFATFPERLVEPCVKAGSPVGGTVLDPFTGSGTTGEVAVKLGRSFVGCELNPEYREMARERIGEACPLLAQEANHGITL